MALGDIDRNVAWQAWHLVTSSFTLRGREECFGHLIPASSVLICCFGLYVSCGTEVPHVTKSDSNDTTATTCPHTTYSHTQLVHWRFVTSIVTLRGRRGTYGTGLTIFDTQSFTHRHRPSFTHHLSHTSFFTHNFVTHHLSHTTLSHTIFQITFSHTIFHTHNFVTHHLSSTSSFVFPSFPVPATTFAAHYWKKLTCGVIRSFNYQITL